MNILPILLSDSYKQFHFKMYPENLRLLYSNMTPRKSRMSGVDEAVFFGLQYYIKEYLIRQWNELFFAKDIEEIVKEYKRFHKNFSGVDIEVEHIRELHALGYLPLSIKALPEGSLVPMRVPFFTIRNTDPRFGWLVNFLETQMSTVIWDMITASTIAHQYRKLLDKWAIKTTGSTEGVQWQVHDFAMRGRSSMESTLNQAGHLLSFTGTDTIPAVLMLEKYYGADIDKELVGASVPATEHSVMMVGGKESEIGTFERLLDKFPTGILSVVSDTWDLWQVCTEFLPKLKDKIMGRDGKLVIRPDSGDPVDIICGEKVWAHREDYEFYSTTTTYQGSMQPKDKGVIELLWDTFGGTVNEQGYKVLDPHIGAIYGDSITLERAEQICERLAAKGFASTNIVLGVGSYTYNYNTRDTFGMAIKATYCEVEEVRKVKLQNANIKIDNESKFIIGREIFKDPVTDSGEKKSARGLLCVQKNEEGKLELLQQVSWDVERTGELKTVFKDGFIVNSTTLDEIRNRLYPKEVEVV